MVNKYLLHDSFNNRECEILKVIVDDVEISTDKYSVVSDTENNGTFITFLEGVLDHKTYCKTKQIVPNEFQTLPITAFIINQKLFIKLIQSEDCINLINSLLVKTYGR